MGQLVLHLASPLSEKVSYFGEVSFTAQPGTYDLSVERSIIRYDSNDYFKIFIWRMQQAADRFLERRLSPRRLARDHHRPPGNGEVWRNVTSRAFRRRTTKETFPPAGWAWDTTWVSATGARRS